ncbi:MAG: hypothetical protein Q4P65_02365 [Eubacteriales bacterium]|nr:hypothetical protein [Eubacteriales bacterium]
MKYEELGLFYLGRETKEDNYYLLRSQDLLTHAFCVGMTGSGKTGLCTALIEEAAIDGIPAIVIDLKGDLLNLCLNFDPITGPKLEPYVSAVELSESGLSRAEFAAKEAEKWNNALAEDEQTSARVQLWEKNSRTKVYTPGQAGLAPLSIVDSFARPEAKILEDEQACNDLLSGYATALLALLGKNSDPLEDREHILLSQILLACWRDGQSPGLSQLIQLVQKPPFDRLGVLDLESFFPEAERFKLALELNKLLAAPSFAAWLEGPSLDIDSLLYAEDGKAQTSIISLQQLSESERSFFLTLLLNKLLAWTRRQDGTQALRALFYMDEIQGYFPPVAEPPTKRPLLSLLKQARAYGLGLVLATQNPVDLDYKGLSNIGVWLVGRLQTERDRSKVLEGMHAADALAGKLSVDNLDELIAGLPKRQFLVRNIHRDGLNLFRSRQTLSYLAGPLSRQNLAELPQLARSEERVERKTVASQNINFKKLDSAERDCAVDACPVEVIKAQLPKDIPGYYLPSAGREDLRPGLIALAEVFYEDKRRGIRQEKNFIMATDFKADLLPVDWSDSEILDIDIKDLTDLDERATYHELPEFARDPKLYQAWAKDLVDYLYKNSTYSIYENKKFKRVARADESERDFRRRLEQELREEREQRLDQYEAKFKARLQSLEKQKLTAEQRVEREVEQASDAKRQTMISFGNAIFSALFGKQKVSSGNIGKMATAARSASRSGKQKSDIERAEAKLQQIMENEQNLLSEMADGLEQLKREFNEDIAATSELELRPLKRDCKVKLIALLWR